MNAAVQSAAEAVAAGLVRSAAAGNTEGLYDQCIALAEDSPAVAAYVMLTLAGWAPDESDLDRYHRAQNTARS